MYLLNCQQTQITILAKKTHKSPEDAKNAILDAAEKLIVDSGPAGLRISAVAKNAGMAHPNIIHHFGSREGLIQALASPEKRAQAMTEVLQIAYEGDQGRASVWLHMSGVESAHKSNMESIVKLSHRLRETVDSKASLDNTNRLVMLIILALVGEVVSGHGIKSSLGFGNDDESRANFKQWLAEILLNLSDEQLSTSLDKKQTD